MPVHAARRLAPRLALVACLLACSRAALAIEFQDGERVVLLGNTLVERDLLHNYLETRLTARAPDRNIVFRNLGWSGDTVWADARAGFDTPADGFARLKQQLFGLKPTVIVLAYGGNEAFEGAAGLDRFVAGYKTLLDMLAETKAQLVLLTPTPVEQKADPLPDLRPHQAELAVYSSAIQQIAGERGLPVIDLLQHRHLAPQPNRAFTDNGIHLNAYGYWRYAVAIEEGLGLPRAGWRVEFDVKTQNRLWAGTQLGNAELSPTSVKFGVRDETLPCPLSPDLAGDPATILPWPACERVLKATGLADGRYELFIDGEPAATGTADEWAAGVTIKAGPEFAQVEQLRAAIGKKNEYYFHRWRPQNDTYLFGFRKYEQGQNAVEIPQFDPLVAEQEAVIAALRQPQPHTYELKRTIAPPVEPQAGG